MSDNLQRGITVAFIVIDFFWSLVLFYGDEPCKATYILLCGVLLLLCQLGYEITRTDR